MTRSKIITKYYTDGLCAVNYTKMHMWVGVRGKSKGAGEIGKKT